MLSFFLNDCSYVDKNRRLSWLRETHISSSCSLGNGVDSKQTRVGVACIESSDLWRKMFLQVMLQLGFIIHSQLSTCDLIPHPPHPHTQQARENPAVWMNYFTYFKTKNWQPLTSKGLTVALETLFISLLLLDPRFTCGPVPSKCCSTPKARASAVPATADWLTTAEWTRLLVLDTRMSPGDTKQVYHFLGCKTKDVCIDFRCNKWTYYRNTVF